MPRAAAPIAFLRAGAGSRSWLAFDGPATIRTTSRPEEVVPLLEEIAAAVAAGWHAVGSLAYEAAAGLDPALPVRADCAQPLAAFALFRPPRRLAALPRRLGEPVSRPGRRGVPAAAPELWRASATAAEQEAAIAAVRAAIARGDCYQVNYTHRLVHQGELDAWTAFRRLLARQPVPWAAYLDLGRWAIASASPELFFRLDGDHVVCRPMKGTAPRAPEPDADAATRRALCASAKERAENLMIVDMVRNDLGRIARPGSVRVAELFRAERYATLWQLTSTVEAQTAAPLPEILRALFPAASITGAPKRAAMARVAALETTPRGVYTGALCWFAPGHRAWANVAIRTLVVDRVAGRSEYGVGGGIVWDSSAAAEIAEARAKAQVLLEAAPRFRLLETMAWHPRTGFRLLGRHLERLGALGGAPRPTAARRPRGPPQPVRRHAAGATSTRAATGRRARAASSSSPRSWRCTSAVRGTWRSTPSRSTVRTGGCTTRRRCAAAIRRRSSARQGPTTCCCGTAKAS